MGKVKYLKEIMKFFERTPVVSIRDINMFIKNKNYSYLLVSNLIKRGGIKRVTKGFYTVHDDPIVSVFCYKPSYIGLQDALSIFGLWEQETNVVIVTVKKVKRRIIQVFGNNVILHRIKPRYMFGYVLMRCGEFYVSVSDLEKTLIDLIYFNEIPDKKVIKELKKRIELKKLKEYLRVYPKRTRERVLSSL